MKNGKPRVVFTYVEAGLGHIMPMTSIENAFRESFGEKCEIMKIYPFEVENQAVNNLGKKLSKHTKNTGNSQIFRRLERLSYILPSKFMLWILDRLFGKKRKAYLEYYKDLKPDLIVSSYYLPSHLAKQSNKRGDWNCLIANYSPDYCTYPAWDRSCDKYFVFNDEAERQCLKRGFKRELVERVPFVFKKGFEDTVYDKQSLRKKFGLDNGNLTVLFTSGAYGSKKTLTQLKKIIEGCSNINIVVGCGRNKNLYNEISKLQSKNGNIITALEFVENLSEYMASADVCVGKASPNTVEESLFIGTPFIMSAVTTAVEEYSLKHYEKNNLCIKAFSTKKIIRAIKNLQGGGCNKYTTVAYEKFRQCGGGKAVAERLFQLLKTRFTDL